MVNVNSYKLNPGSIASKVGKWKFRVDVVRLKCPKVKAIYYSIVIDNERLLNR